MYPLRFEPVYKQKIWGGQRIARLFQRSVNDASIGESWEVCAHPHGMSVVTNGRLQGTTLGELFAQNPKDLVGPEWATAERFPLLVKFIDADDDLSVQVHPDDAYAASHEKGDPGKTEMWYVVAADPGAEIVYGLKPGVDRRRLADLLRHGRNIEQVLNRIPVKAGDVYLIPPGLVHALGTGVVVAEVQQNSDTTYRVYDWGRLEGGKPRELHIEKALAVVKLETPALRQPHSALLVANEYFCVTKVQTTSHQAKLQSCHIIMSLSASLQVATSDHQLELGPGETCLVPAICQYYTLDCPGEALVTALPPRIGGPQRCGINNSENH